MDDLKKNNKQSEFLISEILFNINESENLNDKFDIINNSIKKNNFSQAALVYSISETANKGGKLGWVKESILSKNILITGSEGQIGKSLVKLLIENNYNLILLDKKKKLICYS